MLKKFWAFIGLLGVGFLSFVTFNDIANILSQDPKSIISLMIAMVVVMIYGIQNRKEIFKK